MKNAYLLFLTAILLATCISSCKKDDQSIQAAHVFNPKSHAKVTSTTFPENTTSFADMVPGYDSANTYQRKVALHVANGLKEIVKDSTVSAWIYQHAYTAKVNNVLSNSEIKFEDLFAAFPSTKHFIDSAVDPLGTLTGTPFTTLQSSVAQKGFTFKLGILLINDSVADGEYKPVVVAPLDMYDDRINNHSDVAPAWTLDAANNSTLVNIWKEKAWSTEAPVLTVSFIPNEQPPTPGIATLDQGGPYTDPGTYSDASYIKDYVINYDYDGGVFDGDNDVYITAMMCYTPVWGSSSGSWNVLYFMAGNCSTYSCFRDGQLGSVSRGNVHNTQYCDYRFTRLKPNFELTHNKHCYFNVFEYDWYARYQFLGYANWWGAYINLKGQMSNPWEYYAYDPNQSDFWKTRVDNVARWNDYNIGNPWSWYADWNHGVKGKFHMRVVACH